MRFDGGWVKLHRSIQTSDIARDGAACWIFMKLVMWANIEDGRYEGKPILRGQVITGTRELADATEFSKSTVQRKLDKLEKMNMLGRKPARRGSIITICNYDKFQQSEKPPGTQKQNHMGPSWDRPGTDLGQTWDVNEELENSRIKELENLTLSSPPILGDGVEPKKKKSKKPKVEITDPDLLAIAEDWLRFAKEVQPWRKCASWSVQSFAEAIAEVVEKTDLNQAGIKAVLKFVENDKFWRGNAISPHGLLTLGKNGSRKIDTILVRMKPPEDLVRKAMEDYIKSAPPVGNPFDKWK